MLDLPRPLYGLFFFGIVLILLSFFYICTGRAYARLHGWICRADDPKGFWFEVLLSCVLGFILIGLSFYEG